MGQRDPGFHSFIDRSFTVTKTATVSIMSHSTPTQAFVLVTTPHVMCRPKPFFQLPLAFNHRGISIFWARFWPRVHQSPARHIRFRERLQPSELPGEHYNQNSSGGLPGSTLWCVSCISLEEGSFSHLNALLVPPSLLSPYRYLGPTGTLGEKSIEAPH